jgi:hypothetical protein
MTAFDTITTQDGKSWSSGYPKSNQAQEVSYNATPTYSPMHGSEEDYTRTQVEALSRVNLKLDEIQSQINREDPTTVLRKIRNLWSLKYKLVEEISIVVTHYDEEYVVESNDFDGYGSGETEQDAIKDFCSDLVSFYEELETNHPKLGNDLMLQYYFLKGLITINETV